MLTFTEADHAYYWQGRRVPNVTSIIAPLTDYSHIPAGRLVELQQRGQAVHKMVELDVTNDLDLTTLPEWLKPYFDAWIGFKTAVGLEVWDAERRVYHAGLRYAGTLDLAGVLTKLPAVKGAAIIDVKRSLYGGPAIGLQTIAYQEARNFVVSKDLRTTRRFALVLKALPYPSYTLTEYSDPDDKGAFLACLQQMHWRAKHYPKENSNVSSA